jgi:hypothetical protein
MTRLLDFAYALAEFLVLAWFIFLIGLFAALVSGA